MKPRKSMIAAMVCLVWIAHCAVAQPSEEQQKRYPFVNYAANTLHYDSGATRIRAFFDRWHTMATNGNGSVSIVHIGGSHVQAGLLSNTIRTGLLATQPTLVGPRGMVFPYSAAAKCNNPADYRIHCPQPVLLTRNVSKEHAVALGACGIAVTAHDIPTDIQVVMNEPHVDYHTNRIILIGHSEQPLIPRLRMDSGDIYPTYIDQRTDRYVYNLGRDVDSFEIHIPCREGESFTVGGIYLDNRRDGITLSSLGVNGASVPDYLRCQHFVRDMRLLRPDAVVFGIGINDAVPQDFDTAAFRQNYLRLTDSIRSINPDCAFIFITNNDSYRKTGRRRYKVNRNGELAREVFYRLAHDTGGAVWDQFEVMGGLESMDKWYKSGLARVDRVHFTAVGYRLVGALFTQALLQAYNTETDHTTTLPYDR